MTIIIQKKVGQAHPTPLRQNLLDGWLIFLECILWLANLWAFIVGLVVVTVFYKKKAIKPFWNKPFKMKSKKIENKVNDEMDNKS